MEPAAQRFLEEALTTCQDYDQEGQAVLPNRAWPLILADLGVQEDTDAAYFLMDHLEAAGQGFFSFTPLLQALGSALPEEALPLQTEESQARAPSSPSPVAAPAGPAGAGIATSDDAAPPTGASSTAQVLEVSPMQPTPSRLSHLDGGCGLGRSAAQPMMESDAEELGEAYWSRRGPSIKKLFTHWDCNELSNETFMVHLQALLGELVDVSSPESEFVRKTNQHRSARNLKFAALMTALRRDALSTTARREGRAPSSCAGSIYEPTEFGSEAPSHAAGRPTNAVAFTAGTRSGRRQYPCAEGSLAGGSSALLCAGPAPSPAANGVTTEGGQYEVMSQSGVTDIASVADSQRTDLTMRNHVGHGNILTWGSDSRSITPHKKRQGRQLNMDHPAGVSSSYVSSVRAIFNHET